MKREKAKNRVNGQENDKKPGEIKTVEKKTAEKKPAEKKPGRKISGRGTKRALILAALVFILGLVLEFCANLPALRQTSGKQSAEWAFSVDQLTYEGFREKEGKLTLEAESGTIHIPLDGRFVDKFTYSYDYDGLMNVNVRARVYNEYGELRDRDDLNIQDRNSRLVKQSWVRIGGRVESVDLTVSRGGLFEQGLSYIDFSSMPLTFTGFEAVTRPQFNWYRVCFFWCLLGLTAALFFYRDFFGRRVELGFLLISLSVGTLFSLSLPANKVSWDEEVHFAQAFWLANYRSPVPISPEISQEFIAGIDTWPYNQPDTVEEQRELNAYLDQRGDYRNGEILWSTDLNKTIFTGYAGTALFLKIGQILHLPFSLLFKLGRLGNLLVYCVILYFAIKKTPVGKGIMAFLGLMPEPMMLAGVYSYDPTVTAFCYLAFAYILWAVLEPEKKITWKEYAVILLAFFWGCRIKAVYAPLLLMAFLIPADHFRSNREKWLMRAGFAAVFLLLVASFLLPVLISPSETGDLRGNQTSEVGQMAYILGQPLAYAGILIRNIWNTLPSYVLGENSLGLLGHQGAVPFPWLLYASSAAVILTNGQSSCGKRLDGKQKLWIFLLAAGTVVLVWTSMYMVFTTPGNTYIDGVQGRYYIPLLFLVWLVLNPKCVMVHLKNSDYYSMVLGLGGAILLAAYYMNVLNMFCL